MTLVTVVVSPRRPTPRRLDKEKEGLLGQLLAGGTGSRCLDTLLLAVSKQLRMDDGPVLRSGLTLSTETGLKVPRSKIGRPPPSVLFRFFASAPFQSWDSSSREIAEGCRASPAVPIPDSSLMWG